MRDWEIGLSSWIVQDGNYDDFSRGQTARFAIEFYSKDLSPSTSTEKRADRIKESNYSANGQIVFVNEQCVVLDIGVLSYRQFSPPEWMQAGAWVCGDLYLGIDPFFYFEDLAHTAGMPPMIYEWQLNRIEIETAPFIETLDESGRRLLTRDETKSAFREIERTDAWKDDDGNGAYVLHCSMLERPRTHGLHLKS